MHNIFYFDAHAHSDNLDLDFENVCNTRLLVICVGGEWDYVILSTVRSLPSYKIEAQHTRGWKGVNLGFITDRNQVNVALTRARRGLFIVGEWGDIAALAIHGGRELLVYVLVFLLSVGDTGCSVFCLSVCLSFRRQPYLRNQ